MRPQFDPDLLRTFVAIAEGGNFRRAAGRVGRTQPAVSMQIQRIEQNVGRPLFNRDRPTIQLTQRAKFCSASRAVFWLRNRLCAIEFRADQILADAEASGRSYLTEWLSAAVLATTTARGRELLEIVEPLTEDTTAFEGFIEAAMSCFDEIPTDEETANDLAEDLSAWREINSEISRQLGRHPTLDQFLQELGLRSTDPSPKPGTVTLITIHDAKVREFDFVYLVGLAEDVMPSYQSRQKGDASPEMEEERRNCSWQSQESKRALCFHGRIGIGATLKDHWDF
jgi:superfamily I DNA/RNA helicase